MDLKLIKEIRKFRGKSLTQLSVDTKISKNTLSKMEREGSNPSFKNVEKVCEALGYEIRILIK